MTHFLSGNEVEVSSPVTASAGLSFNKAWRLPLLHFWEPLAITKEV